MTQDEQEADLFSARVMTGQDGITLDRCRHDSVMETSIWVYRDGKQVGSVTRAGDAWTATRLLRGMPTGQRSMPTLRDAMSYAQEK